MSARVDIWKLVQAKFPCLVRLAQDIALEVSKPSCPMGYPPLNLLANGEPPIRHPAGLSGLVVQPTIAALAAAKGGDPEGFRAKNAAGLGITFGTWSDFCLWCWAKYRSDYDEGGACRLILASDFGPLADILPPTKSNSNTLQPGIDWGETELLRFYSSTDPSTTRLFDTLHRAANPNGKGDPFSGNVANQQELERFIASKRIFIYNVWPWFRSGAQSTGNSNIHASLHCARQVVNYLQKLVACLKPSKIACLGGWSWDTSRPRPDSMMRGPFALSRVAKIDVFRHPSARSPYHWTDKWKNPHAWGQGYRWQGIPNDRAFIDYIV